MSTVQITVPAGAKDSKAFTDALKVSLAVAAYNAPVQWVKSTFLMTGGNVGAAGNVTLEKEKWKLTEADVIVQYCLRGMGLTGGICLRRRGGKWFLGPSGH
jgi:hypothetical protein